MWTLVKCLLWLCLVAALRHSGASATPGLLKSDSLVSQMEAEPESICRHCFCHGLTVNCNFAHNHTLSPVWNNTYMVPSSIVAMEVRLTDRTQFQLHSGLFRTNRVNRFVVNGANDADGGDQVELTHNAFRGNFAGLPDIQIIGVSNVFVREQAFSDGEIKLTVENSRLLVLFPSAFVNMNMSCNFTNITSLDIREKAFNPSTNRSKQANVNLHIQQSKIDQIDSFDVSMNKIVYLGCSIGVIQRHAFHVTNVKELSFENCSIRRIEPYAFTDKLHSEHISITGSQIGTIDSAAISGSGISNFTLRQNVIDTIKEVAIQVNSVYVFIERNTIAHQGNNWLHIHRGEMVVIEDNRFTNFAPIQLEQSNRINCSFANNWLGDPQPGSLNFSNCEMRAMTVDHVCDQSCDGNQLWLATLTEHDVSSELYCQLPESSRACFNATAVHLRRYENEACGRDRKLQCVDGSKLEWFNGVYVTKEERERQQRGATNTEIIVIGLSIIVPAVVLVTLLAVFCWRCRNHHSVKQAHCHFSSEDCQVLRLDMKRETKSYFKQLISGTLSSEQCVYTIEKVLQQHYYLISLAAKHVLVRHLEQAHLKRMEVEGYGTRTLLGGPSAPSDYSSIHVGGVDGDLQQENIYAVPNYSSPQDSLDAGHNVYSEPNHVVSDGHDNYTPPPAYAPPSHQPPPPSWTENCGAIYATPFTSNSAPINVPPPAIAKSAQLHSRLRSMPRRPQPSGSTLNRSYDCLDGAASLDAMELMDMRGATALPPDSGSDHSGGSDETVKIDDVENADAGDDGDEVDNENL